MNANQSPSTRRSSGGCGCHSAGAPVSPANGTGCSCRKPACETCADDGFVRPKFFAGQLLTEDDLELLTQYVGNKNRLHNRFLFGEGVVCGLQVACHPCGGGVVRVLPGYALDCCGNDIVVPCPTELNVNAMIHQLRVDTLGGIDCGDPCPPKPTAVQAAARAAEAASVRRQVIGTPLQPGVIVEKQDEEPPGQYCLYIRYCEQQVEPVTPYVTDAACGQQACEPSRIREGFRFEIRCRTEKDAPDDIVTRLMGCYGDPKDLAELATTARTMLVSAIEIDGALTAAADTVIQPLSSTESNDLAGSTALLDGAAFVNREIVTRIQGVATLLARYILLDPAPATPTGAQIAAVRTSLTNAVNRLRPLITGSTRPLEGLEARWADAVFDVCGQVAALPDPPNAQQAADASIRLLGAGAVYSAPLHNDYAAALDGIRRQLMVMLERGAFSDCTLPGQVGAVEIPASRTSTVTLSDAAAFVSANHQLIGVWLRYMIDCFCGALNPPCKPCDDPAVLLACIEIQDCAVTDICNMERTFVLSPTGLRHWLPPLRLVGSLFELLCCDVRGSIFGGFKQKSGRQSQAGRYVQQLMGGVRTRRSFTAAALSTLAGLYGLKTPDAASLPYVSRGLRDLAKVAELRVRAAIRQPKNVVGVKDPRAAFTMGAVANAMRNTQRETLDERIDRIVAQRLDALTAPGGQSRGATPPRGPRAKPAKGGQPGPRGGPAAPAGGKSNP
jgi:hypothetical protein